MSNALKCDRCGKLYEYYSGIRLVKDGNSFCRFDIVGNCGYQKYDLCKECMSSLVDWIKEKNNEPK